MDNDQIAASMDKREGAIRALHARTHEPATGAGATGRSRSGVSAMSGNLFVTPPQPTRELLWRRRWTRASKRSVSRLARRGFPPRSLAGPVELRHLPTWRARRRSVDQSPLSRGLPGVAPSTLDGPRRPLASPRRPRPLIGRYRCPRAHLVALPPTTGTTRRARAARSLMIRRRRWLWRGTAAFVAAVFASEQHSPHRRRRCPRTAVRPQTGAGRARRTAGERRPGERWFCLAG